MPEFTTSRNLSRALPRELRDPVGDLLDGQPRRKQQLQVGNDGRGRRPLERARRGAHALTLVEVVGPGLERPAPLTVAQILNARAESTTPSCASASATSLLPIPRVTWNFTLEPAEPGRSWYANHPPATRNGSARIARTSRTAQTAAAPPAPFAGRRVAPLRARVAPTTPRPLTRGRLATLPRVPPTAATVSVGASGAYGAGRIGGPGGRGPPGAGGPARRGSRARGSTGGGPARRGSRARGSTGGGPARRGSRARGSTGGGPARRGSRARGSTGGGPGRRGLPGSRGWVLSVNVPSGRGGPCPSAGQRRPRRRGTTGGSRPLRRHRQVRASGASDASRAAASRSRRSAETVVSRSSCSSTASPRPATRRAPPPRPGPPGPPAPRHPTGTGEARRRSGSAPSSWARPTITGVVGGVVGGTLEDVERARQDPRWDPTGRARCGASRDRPRAPGPSWAQPARRVWVDTALAADRSAASASSIASAFGPATHRDVGLLPAVPPPTAAAAPFRDGARPATPRSMRSVLTATATPAFSRRAGAPTRTTTPEPERVPRRDGEPAQLVVREPVAPRSTTTPSTAVAASVCASPAVFSAPLGVELLAELAISARSRSTRSGTLGRRRPGAPPRLAEQRLLVVDVLERAVAGHGLDAAQVRADRALAHDLDRPDEPERVHVRAAAQLDRVLSGFEHAHEVAVLVAEERDRAEALGVVLRRLVVTHRRVGDDLGLASSSTASSCSGVTASWWLKSKRSRSGATSEPACFTCGAEHLAQRPVQDVRRGVVAADPVAAHAVDRAPCTPSPSRIVPSVDSRSGCTSRPGSPYCVSSTLDAHTVGVVITPVSPTWPPDSA